MHVHNVHMGALKLLEKHKISPLIKILGTVRTSTNFNLLFEHIPAEIFGIKCSHGAMDRFFSGFLPKQVRAPPAIKCDQLLHYLTSTFRCTVHDECQNISNMATGRETRSNPVPKFEIGEKVLCYEPDPNKARVLYESKVCFAESVFP